jgi:hypothetical protein
MCLYSIAANTMSGTEPGDRQTPIGDTAGWTVYYDEHSDTYHTWIDDDDPESISTIVVLTVSAVRGVDPDSVAPLAMRLDPDALDALFADRANGMARTADGIVSFPYAECHVTVRSGGEIVVESESGV